MTEKGGRANGGVCGPTNDAVDVPNGITKPFGIIGPGTDDPTAGMKLADGLLEVTEVVVVGFVEGVDAGDSDGAAVCPATPLVAAEEF